MSDICKLSTKIVKLENFGGGEGAVVYADVVKRAAEVRGGNASDVQRACVYAGAGRNRHMMPTGVAYGGSGDTVHIASGAREVVPVKRTGINGNGRRTVQIHDFL